MIRTLADLTARTGQDVLEHLDRQVTIPVVSGAQAQGDLFVIPHDTVADSVHVHTWATSRQVPAQGMELLRSAAGGNPHTLIAESGDCRWFGAILDREHLAIGLLDTQVIAYLIHPEHGGTGLAPGRYVIRRQREGGGFLRPGSSSPRSRSWLVAD